LSFLIVFPNPDFSSAILLKSFSDLPVTAVAQRMGGGQQNANPPCIAQHFGPYQRYQSRRQSGAGMNQDNQMQYTQLLLTNPVRFDMAQVGSGKAVECRTNFRSSPIRFCVRGCGLSRRRIEGGAGVQHQKQRPKMITSR